MVRRDDEQDYSLERLISPGAVGLTSLPLRLGRSIVVPLVNSLKIARVTPYSGGTKVTLTWIDPEDYRDAISTFRVYMTSRDNPTPTMVAEPVKSPVVLTIPSTDTAQKVTLRVQTALRNGQVSAFEFSPTASVSVS